MLSFFQFLFALTDTYANSVGRFTPGFILVLVSLTILKMGSLGLCLDAFMMTRRIVLPKGLLLRQNATRNWLLL